MQGDEMDDDERMSLADDVEQFLISRGYTGDPAALFRGNTPSPSSIDGKPSARVPMSIGAADAGKAEESKALTDAFVAAQDATVARARTVWRDGIVGKI